MALNTKRGSRKQKPEVKFDCEFDSNVFRQLCWVGNINIHSEVGRALHDVAGYGDTVAITVKRKRQVRL